MALLRLFDPTTQFQTKSGALNVAGKLRIYIESTDDLANIYGDDGSLLSQPLILDSNGRARGLFVDSGRSYRLEAYDRNDSLLFTIRRLEPNASGTIINPTVFIKGTPDEIDVEDSVTEESRTYTVALSAKVKGKIDENREAIVKESEARKDADDELRKMIDNKQNSLTFDDEPTAGSTNPVTSDGIKTAISNSVDQTYSSTSTKAQSGVAVNEAFKTRETSTSDDSYTYLGMTLNGPSTEKLYWKLVSFKPLYDYWTLQFEIDVCNGRKAERSFDTEIYETKRLTIYSYNKDTVDNAIELRYSPQTMNDKTRGYGNNIYYEMDSSKTVTVYIYAKRKPNTTQICRLTSVRNLKGIDNITWHEAAYNAGTQPTNPIKFKEDFPAIASTSSDIGSDSVPVYVRKGKPVSCNSSNLKAGKDDDGNVIKNTYQKKLTFDTTPKAGSSNPVTSDGIKTALNNYVGIYKGDSSNFHVKNNEYYSFICRTNISNWEKIQADFFCPNSDSSTVGKFNIFATLSTTDTSLHTPERVAELGGIVWDYNYKGYNTIKYRIYVAKSGNYFYFYAKRNSSNDKSITAFRSCLLYTTNPGLTDNVSADLDDATWQTLSLVEMKNVYSSTTQERLDSHTNDTTAHITEAERKAWNAKQSALVFDSAPTAGSTNPVTSDGIKTAIEALQSNIDTVDAKGIVINEINGENVICFE